MFSFRKIGLFKFKVRVLPSKPVSTHFYYCRTQMVTHIVNASESGFSRPKMYFFVLLVKFWHDINFCSILFRERATTAHQATEEGGMDGEKVWRSDRESRKTKSFRTRKNKKSVKNVFTTFNVTRQQHKRHAIICCTLNNERLNLTQR